MVYATKMQNVQILLERSNALVMLITPEMVSAADQNVRIVMTTQYVRTMEHVNATQATPEMA